MFLGEGVVWSLDFFEEFCVEFYSNTRVQRISLISKPQGKISQKTPPTKTLLIPIPAQFQSSTKTVHRSVAQKKLNPALLYFTHFFNRREIHKIFFMEDNPGITR
jgi:hypothetical protein